MRVEGHRVVKRVSTAIAILVVNTSGFALEICHHERVGLHLKFAS